MTRYFSFSFGLVPGLKTQIQHSGVDIRIGELGNGVFNDVVIKGEEMVKLPHGIVSHGRWAPEFIVEIGQIQIGDVCNEFNTANFQENTEFVQSNGQCLLGALGEICKPAVVQERGDVTLKHDALSISRDHASPSNP